MGSQRGAAAARGGRGAARGRRSRGAREVILGASQAAIAMRAEKIQDAAARMHYLTRVPAHVRVGELARRLQIDKA